MSTTDDELSAQALEMAKHWHRAGIAEQDICEAMVATGIAGTICAAPCTRLARPRSSRHPGRGVT